MGKTKGGSKKSSKPQSAPKCTCDHPYNCSCGNRPPRPSKGHKWDSESQEWGGKGHKQKGASGQTASVAVEAKTTSVGRTTIEQWQRLPSQLLDEVCRREGRPRPKYKSIASSEQKQKYRVIVQDAKVARRGTDHDLMFVPSSYCDNEEQAKEEAALLALLHMTPTLPHERKLPEPYKTTWLHAVDAAKHNKAPEKLKRPAAAPQPSTKSSDSGTSGGAKATVNLSMDRSFVSLADRRRQKESKRNERNTRIRKHMAMLEANRDHQVFLSAKCRQQIETLLRGDSVRVQDLLVSEEIENDEDEEEEGIDDLKVYVLQRLHSEGFTRAQARTAYGQLEKLPEGGVDEEEWDNVYDECLQWLCIHLNEDQLPEGFDPRGRTLDVVLAKAKNGGDKKADTPLPENADALRIAKNYGITAEEASLVLNRATNMQQAKELLWSLFCKAADFALPSIATFDDAQNLEATQEEQEALQAIFPPEACSIERNGGHVLTKIFVTSEPGSVIELEIVVEEGKYPSTYPERILVSGACKGTKAMGVALHVGMIKFLKTLSLGDPMMYDLYCHLNTLLQEQDNGALSPVSLMPWLEEHQVPLPDPDVSRIVSVKSDKAVKSKPIRRPRERSFFWSKTPKETPPAIAFPKVSAAIENARKKLPAAKAREEFLAAMKRSEESGRVLILSGETGCGKTLEIPQFILEDSPADVKIVVAQPRRLAATAVAARVATERGESEAGTGSVGYVVRGDTAVCERTRLLYCTTGVLLRQLQSDGALDAVTHIVVDEVHERHLDTDVLLGVLKECISQTPHLKVVLMSATLDADRFAAYWGSKTPRIHIPGRTFPVQDYTLEDVLTLTGYIPPKKGKKLKRVIGGYAQRKNSTPWADSERSQEEEDDDELNDEPQKEDSSSHTNAPSQNIPLDELVKRVDESNIDYDMLGQLVKRLVQTKGPENDGSILVFLPGAPEINVAMDTTRKIARGLSIQMLPLHGGLQPRDQNLVFRAPQKGFTKIIFSTNVAETSITIPDCTIVIDSCREKQSAYDPSNRMPLLVERFAAKDSLKQRRGRAGRVQAGVCYRLVSSGTLSRLPDHGEPEIRRCALDQTLLSLLFLGVENGSGRFLNKLLDPPSKQSVDAAIFSLQKLGAVTSGTEVVSLTPLGMQLAGIPAPPSVGKILVMGSILGCRSATLAMAAGMSVGRSPFLRIDNKRGNQEEDSVEDTNRRNILEAREELFKRVGNSDHAVLAAAYLQWDSIRTGASDRKRICESLGLSFNGMKEMKQLVRQLDSSLAASGYKSSPDADRNAKSWRIIRACAVAAMAPGQLVRVQRPRKKYSETAEGAIEKDGVARELQFYIRSGEAGESQISEHGPSGVNQRYHGIAEERVFFHPSSANFSVGSYHCPWLVYHQLVRTSKAFLRDATECSAYALLLFGGKLDVQAGKGLIVIDNWARLAANARIGALIGGLRRRVDELLGEKVKDPGFDIAGTTEMRLIVSLLISDGLG